MLFKNQAHGSGLLWADDGGPGEELLTSVNEVCCSLVTALELTGLGRDRVSIARDVCNNTLPPSPNYSFVVSLPNEPKHALH